MSTGPDCSVRKSKARKDLQDSVNLFSTAFLQNEILQLLIKICLNFVILFACLVLVIPSSLSSNMFINQLRRFSLNLMGQPVWPDEEPEQNILSSSRYSIEGRHRVERDENTLKFR